jgi:hypothetical protein
MTELCCATQAGFELPIFLPLPHEWWDESPSSSLWTGRNFLNKWSPEVNSSRQALHFCTEHGPKFL